MKKRKKVIKVNGALIVLGLIIVLGLGVAALKADHFGMSFTDALLGAKPAVIVATK